ncbi:MAG: hypothetical protein HY569_01625 [Candidatus Magasanikbacteria bacterium]|nr:hypothetical protein [Candidatus Magasanikbacteria bacterium]
MLWIDEYPALRRECLKVFINYLLPAKTRKKIYRQWHEEIKRLLRWHKRIESVDLRALTNKELLFFWRGYHKDYRDFWIDGMVPELGGYGADKLFEEKLKNFVSDDELNGVLEILTAPTRLSFYQEEERDLARTKDLNKHQRGYFWLKNSYAGTEILPVKFFKDRQLSLRGSADEALTKQSSHRVRVAMIKQRKFDLCKKYGLSNEIMDISEAISMGIAWQDERKKYIFITLHYQDLLLKEVGRRFGYDKDDLLNTWYYEIDKIIAGQDLRGILRQRRNGVGVDFFRSCRTLVGSEVKRLWKKYEYDARDDLSDVISGLVVSKGSGSAVRGRARILLDPSRADEFKTGEILVAPMTSPEYIFAMRKAAAIVTDAGGLTCHAAIVSRELGIPCIVGTKIATKALEDGDLVEVDANHGTVKKL